jgi:hypothetical protein
VLFPHPEFGSSFLHPGSYSSLKGNYQLSFIEFTQQHPTPPREVMTNLVITSLFLWPACFNCCRNTQNLPDDINPLYQIAQMEFAGERREAA